MLKTVLKLSILPILGMLISGAGFYTLYQKITEKSIAVVTTPGEKAFRIQEPDVYVVWHSNSAIIDDTFMSGSWDLPAELQVAIVNADSGTTVPLVAYQGASAQSGSYNRQSLFKAELMPGDYRLVSHSKPGRAVTLELTRNTGFRAILMFFGVISLGSIVFTVGLVVIAVRGGKYLLRYWRVSGTQKELDIP